MARKPKSVSDIDREIEALKKQRVEALEAQSIHVGKLAARAGLTTLDISDAELLEAFKGIVERFQKPATKPAPASH